MTQLHSPRKPSTLLCTQPLNVFFPLGDGKLTAEEVAFGISKHPERKSDVFNTVGQVQKTHTLCPIVSMRTI